MLSAAKSFQILRIETLASGEILVGRSVRPKRVTSRDAN